MSSVYCYFCSRKAHRMKYGKRMCQACINAFEAGMKKAVDNLKEGGAL